MQVNVVSPFSGRFNSTREQYNHLVSLGVDSVTLGEFSSTFGREEAVACRQVLEAAAIDNLHVITVCTEGFDSRVEEMAEAVVQEFDSKHHTVAELASGHYHVRYLLPEECYWKEQTNNSDGECEYCLSASTRQRGQIIKDMHAAQFKRGDAAFQ